MLNLLRRALSDRKRNVEVSAQIYEGKPLEQILPESNKGSADVKLNPQWWLERFFRRHKLSFAQGAFIIYLVKVVPTILQISILGNRLDVNTLNAIYSTFLGDMSIPISLILIDNIYKSWVNLTKTINENLKENRFVAPPILITEKELKSSKDLDSLDRNYSNRYIKPVALKTLQSGLNLTFNKSYQLGSGAISSSILLLLIFLGCVARILPTDVMFRPTDFGSLFLNVIGTGVHLFAWTMDWFIIGFLAWTLFTTFLCIVQVSGNPLKARPFEQVKKRFAPVFSLILKTTLTVAFVVAWVSPFTLLWSILPPDPLGRQNMIYFVESILAVMIPVIVLSFLSPIMKVHKALSETCDRLLLLKSHQLEDIKKFRESEPDKYMKIEKHLILDYKDVQRNQVWFFDLWQGIQLVGSVLLPLVTFWLSIMLR